MTDLLKIEDLHVVFSSTGTVVRALNGLDLSLPVGHAIAIVGESGSGKSTLASAIMRILPSTSSTSGRVLFDGQDLLGLPSKEMRLIRGRSISMIFQNPTMYLNPTKTVGQQIIEPLLYHHLATPAQARKKAIDLLDQVGIPDPDHRFRNYPFEFSGGMLQRAMIAMALITDPKLLIADEPTTALDVTVQAEILVLLKALRKDRGMSLIFVTHDLAVAAQIADEIYVMYGGLVVEHINSSKIVTERAHPYLGGLIRSIPRVDVDPGPLYFIPGQPIRVGEELPPGCVFAARCQYRQPICKERPALLPVSQSHDVACWLPLKEGSA